jgi:hypothetical protein
MDTTTVVTCGQATMVWWLTLVEKRETPCHKEVYHSGMASIPPTLHTSCDGYCKPNKVD